MPGSDLVPLCTVDGMHHDRRHPGAMAGMLDTCLKPGFHISEPYPKTIIAKPAPRTHGHGGRHEP